MIGIKSVMSVLQTPSSFYRPMGRTSGTGKNIGLLLVVCVARVSRDSTLFDCCFTCYCDSTRPFRVHTILVISGPGRQERKPRRRRNFDGRDCERATVGTSGRASVCSVFPVWRPLPLTPNCDDGFR